MDDKVVQVYTEKQILQFAEFIAKYQLEADGSTKMLQTAILDAKERLEFNDFRIRPENSVDGKEHVFEFGK